MGGGGAVGGSRWGCGVWREEQGWEIAGGGG